MADFEISNARIEEGVLIYGISGRADVLRNLSSLRRPGCGPNTIWQRSSQAYSSLSQYVAELVQGAEKVLTDAGFGFEEVESQDWAEKVYPQYQSQVGPAPQETGIQPAQK